MNCESLGNICTLRLFFDEIESRSMRTAEQFFVVDLTLLKNGASLIADHRYLIGVGSHKLAFEAPQLFSARNDPKVF